MADDPFADIASGPDKNDPFSDIAPSEETTALGAAARSAGTAVGPGLGAAAGGAAGWALGAALAPETGGLSMAIPLIGMFLGGAGGGALTEAAQRKALELAAPETASRLQELQQLDVAQHPGAALVGRLAGTAPTFAVAPGQTIRGLAAIPSVIARTATPARTREAASAALQLGLGTAGGVISPLLHGEAPTLAGIGESALQASVFGAPRAKVFMPRSLRALSETPKGETPAELGLREIPFPEEVSRSLLRPGSRWPYVTEPPPIITQESLFEPQPSAEPIQPVERGAVRAEAEGGKLKVSEVPKENVRLSTLESLYKTVKDAMEGTEYIKDLEARIERLRETGREEPPIEKAPGPEPPPWPPARPPALGEPVGPAFPPARPPAIGSPVEVVKRPAQAAPVVIGEGPPPRIRQIEMVPGEQPIIESPGGTVKQVGATAAPREQFPALPTALGGKPLKTAKQVGWIRGTAAEKWADKVISENPFRDVPLGVDPVKTGQRVAAWTIKGAALLEQGIRDAAAWSAEMIRLHGEPIKPYLEGLWNESQAMLRSQTPRQRQEKISAGAETGTAPPAASTVQEPAAVPARPAPPAPTPSPQALGFLSPGGRLLNQIVNAIKPKSQATLPSTPSTAGDFLPDLGDRAQNKAIAVEPTGIGRIPVLNWLFDPRHRAKTEPEKSIINYFYEQAVGKSHVQALGSTFGTRFKEMFPRREAGPGVRPEDVGEFTTVERTHEGQSLHPSDVFEQMQRDPNSYRMTPEQRQAFDELMRYEKRARELERQYGMAENPETNEVEPGSPGENAYYTRGKVIGQPPRGTGMGGVATGARQFFQKRRSFESEQQGVSKGFQYPMNVDDRILLRLSRLYKAVADRRLADDPGLGGRWGSDTGPVTYHEGQVFQPAFRSGVEYRIFPVEVANKINSTLASQQTQWLKSMQNVSDVIRSIQLGFDVGWGFIQGLPTAFKEPTKWANAQATSFRALTNPDAFSAYARNNVEPIRELAQFGSSVGNLPEMAAGLREGGPLSRIPGATQFGRAFQTFLDIAKIEKWKSRREITPREEWPRAIQEIEHELGSGRMEAIGVSPGQALAERFFLLAPSYYRGGLGLIGDMFQGGVTGNQARRAMAAHMAGMTATFIAGAVATGMPWEEIKRRLLPNSGNFMMIPIKLGSKSLEVGFGGIMRSFMRLAGSAYKTSMEHPENWGTLATDKNPFTKWLRGHAAPIPSKALDAFSGKDYAGEDTDLRSLGRGSLMLALQSILKREKGQTLAQTVGDATASFMGLSSWPQNTHNALLVERNRIAREKYGAPYENLKIRQQALVARALEKNPEFAKRVPTEQQISQAFRHQVEREQAVNAGLDAPIREVLTEKEIRVPGFDPNLKVGPSEILLTDAQQARYKALIIEEYNKTLKRRLNILRKATPLRGQDLLTDWAGDAKQRAQTRLQLEFNR